MISNTKIKIQGGNGKLESQIRNILSDIVLDPQIETSQDFIEDGLIDSLDIVKMVVALEKNFDVHISGDSINRNNFKNIKSIKLMIQKIKN